MSLTIHPPLDATLRGQSLEIQAGRLSCRELFDRCRSAVAERDSDLRAWVSFGGDGVEQTVAERDAELRRGFWRGPLHGIPIGVKDIYDVQGLPTLAAIPHRAVEPATADSTMVARLRRAGAVIVGKTVTTPYAFFDPPPTRNPWNRDRTPGGSSSGSAAAVASGMCLGALGSQTGGSITRPASFCGIAGYKPTFGWLSRRGLFPFSPSLDHPGPMARTIDDLALLMTALAPRWLRYHFQQRLSEPSLPTVDQLPTFVVAEGAFTEKSQPAMQQALADTIELLCHRGARVVNTAAVELELPNMWRHHRCVMAVEIAASQAENLTHCPDQFTPAVKALIEEGYVARSVNYAKALQFRREKRMLLRNVMAGDIWLLPAACGEAPTPETTGDPCMNSPWSFLGFPTITIPMALSPAGLPLGLQLVAGPGQDLALFRAAKWCESVLRRQSR
jgi:aspartyl-tRNA(Asn)/glutamyl-tRNA(Gln) amidotransferase subunit A